MINILAFSPHPDDIELYAGGALLLHSKKYKIGIIDLTEGEMSSNGTIGNRKTEAIMAKNFSNTYLRENLKIPDGGIQSSNIFQQNLVIDSIIKYKPSIILLPYSDSSHPDHFEATELIERSVFKAASSYNNFNRHHTCYKLIYYLMDTLVQPNLLLDISTVYDKKIELINIYTNQFSYSSEVNKKTLLNKGNFIDKIKSRDSYYGSIIETEFAEGFFIKLPVITDNFFKLSSIEF